MDKEEILARSREENNPSDERQKSLLQKAQAVSGAVGMTLCCIIALLEMLLSDSNLLFYGCFSIYWGINATEKLVYALSAKKKQGWIRTTINLLLFVAFMTKLILELI